MVNIEKTRTICRLMCVPNLRRLMRVWWVPQEIIRSTNSYNIHSSRANQGTTPKTNSEQHISWANTEQVLKLMTNYLRVDCWVTSSICCAYALNSSGLSCVRIHVHSLCHRTWWSLNVWMNTMNVRDGLAVTADTWHTFSSHLNSRQTDR